MMRGFAAMSLPNGVRHVAIHYSADEDKDEAWVQQTRAGMAAEGKGERDWQREMELKEDIYEGEPVYADYIDALHCPAAYHDRPFPILKDSLFVGGWDCGGTLHPAFVLLQVTRLGQVLGLTEVLPPAPEPMETFAPRVGEALVQILPGNWDDVEHVADATVIQRSGVDGRTAQGEAKRHGFYLKPISNVWNVRYSAVTWALKDRIDEETPRFMYCGMNCPVLRAGFQGAYKYDQAPKSESTGPGRILRMPLKNGYSHVHDGLQAAMIRARQLVQQRA